MPELGSLGITRALYVWTIHEEASSTGQGRLPSFSADLSASSSRAAFHGLRSSRRSTNRSFQTAPASCPGHESTSGLVCRRHARSERFYVIEIRFSQHPPVHIQSICTFTPTMGMDRVDGELAQDAEELVLQEVSFAGVQSRRLPTSFQRRRSIPVMLPCLRSRVCMTTVMHSLKKLASKS